MTARNTVEWNGKISDFFWKGMEMKQQSSTTFFKHESHEMAIKEKTKNQKNK